MNKQRDGIEIGIVDFGLQDYRKIWDMQRAAFNKLINDKREKKTISKEYLFIGEHYPVYTLGFHGKSGNMLATDAALTDMGIELIRIERGGDITYHGPGQMIAYPVIDLENHGLGIKGYMDCLEDCIITLLYDYGIKGEKVDNAIGIWIDKGTSEERKICAMGVKCTRFVTMHGLALNVSTDLNAFNVINPCGFTDRGVTSIARETGHVPSMQEMKKRFVEIFIDRFQPHIPSLENS